MEDPPSKQGWLLKKAVRTLGKLNWKRRFVVVAANAVPAGSPPSATLRYYEGDSRTSKMKNAVVLHSGSIASRSTEHGKPHELLIKAVDGTHFFACAESEAEADDWVTSIQRILKPVISAPAMPAGAASSVAKPVVPSATPASPPPPPPSLGPPPPPVRTAAAAAPAPMAPAPAGGGGAEGGVRSIFDLVKRVESRVATATVSGANDLGQLGTSTVTNAGVSSAEAISALALKLQPVAVSAGYRHAAAITVGSALMVWGDGAGAQLGVDASLRRSIRPHLVVPLRSRRVLAVACGGSHTLAIVADGPAASGAAAAAPPVAGPLVAGSAAAAGGGELFVWGSSAVGALGLGGVNRVVWTPAPVAFPGLPRGQRVTYIAAGLVSSAAVVVAEAAAAGGESAVPLRLFVWGDASHGRLGLRRPPQADASPVADPVTLPQELSLRCSGRPLVPVSVACGGSFTAFLGRPLPPPPGAPLPPGPQGGYILLVSGALGFECSVLCGPLPADGAAAAGSAAGTVSVELTPPPEALVAREAAGAGGPVIVLEPAVTAETGDRPCVSAVAAGPSHLLVVVQEALPPPKPSLAARMVAAAAAAEGGASAPPPAPPSSSVGPPRFRGRVFSAGWGYLGHDSDLCSQGNYASARLRPVSGIMEDEDAADVAAGHGFSVVRSMCGELVGWGESSLGQLRTGKYMDVFMPVAAKDPEGTHCEQIAAGFNFTAALFYPGLLGSAKSRNAAKNVFSKWRAKAKARLGKDGGDPMQGGKSLDDILREAAGDAGMAGAFGGDLTLSDLMAQLTAASEADPDGAV